MKFCFAADAVADNRCWRYLDELLNTADDGWHEWKIDDPETIEESKWFLGTNRPHIKESFEKAIKAGAYSAANSLHKHLWNITNQADSINSLSPQVAVIYFKTPLRICVENEFTDGLFIDTILSFLASQELKGFLICFQQGTKKPFDYLHGGGTGELCKQIERRVKESAGQGIRFRAVTVTDSDARFPGDTEGMRKALEIDKVCRNRNIPCLVLNKRTIENYIPDEVLQGWSDESGNQTAKELVNVVCGLSAEQRNHLPMKPKGKGQLPADDHLTPQELALYASIPIEQRSLLASSKLRGNLNLLETYKRYLTEDGLRKRDGQGELDRLVAMITEEL